MPGMCVYVRVVGAYENATIHGVYTTLDAAQGDASGWREQSNGYWINDEGREFATIVRHRVIAGDSLPAAELLDFRKAV